MKIEALFLTWFLRFLEVGYRDYRGGTTKEFATFDCNHTCICEVEALRCPDCPFGLIWLVGLTTGVILATLCRELISVRPVLRNGRNSPRRHGGGVVRPPGWEDTGRLVLR